MGKAVEAPPVTTTDFQAINDWSPDVPPPQNTGLLSALNIFPKANGFYGPARALVDLGGTKSTTPFGNALKVHGSLHSRQPVLGDVPEYYVGTYAIADGDSRLLGRQEQGDWSDLSKVGGYNATQFTPWRFDNFGLKVLAVNEANTLQISDGTLGQFRDVNSRVRGIDVATVAGFGVIISTNDLDFGDGSQPFRVWWSAIGNAENFPDPLSDEAINVQSGFFDLFGGGQLQRIVSGIGGADAIVIAERKMWRMTFVGPPQTFRFDEIGSDVGTTIPGSVVRWENKFFFYGHNGLYLFDGANVAQIGQGVWDEFFDSDAQLAAAFGNQNSIQGGLDTENKNYILSYRNSDALDDRNNVAIRYNWITQKSSQVELAIDSLGHVDSFAARLNAPRVVMLSHNFQIARPIGATLEMTMDTAERTDGQGNYTEIQGILPYCDADGIRARIMFRDRLFDLLLFSPERQVQDDGFIRFYDDQPSARFYRCRYRIPAGVEWTTITGMLYDATAHSAGTRRRP